MSIFQQYLQPVRSLTQRMADFDALDMQREDLTARRQQNALQALAARKAIEADEVAREDGNQLQRIAGQYGSDQNALIQALRGSGRVGLMGRADALEKALLERQKADAAVGKDKAETLKTHLGALKTLAGGVMANPTAEAAMFAIDAFERFTGRRMPEERARIAQLQTPDDVKRWAAGHALSADKLLPQVQNRDTGGQVQTLAIDPLTGRPTVTGAVDKTVTPDAVMTDRRAREEGAANRGVQMRGQNLTDARARESVALQREANATVYDPERGVLVNKATGLARPAATMDGRPIGQKEKPLTEGQARAFQFATRMEASNNILADLEKDGKVFSTPGSRAPFAGPAVNVLNTEKAQQLDQAKRDFINAVLRRESGAVISEPEFNNAEKQYFPQIGDGPAVIAQKARNRKLAIEGVKADIPRQYQDDFADTLKRTQPASGQAPSMPAIGDIDAELRRRGVIK